MCQVPDTKGEAAMRGVIAVIGAAALIAIGPVQGWAAQRGLPPGAEATAFKQMASAIPLGSRVKVHTAAGGRLTATLMTVTDEAIVVQRASRVPEPAIAIPFGEIRRLERDQGGKGISIGKAIGVGVAAGASAILTMFAIVFSLDD